MSLSNPAARSRPRLLLDHDAAVATWVADRAPIERPDFGQHFSAVGVLDSRGALVAGAVFHNYKPGNATIELSGAAMSALVFRPDVIRDVLAIPFRRFGVFKVWAQTAHDNRKAVALLRGVGFRQEAVLARHYGAKHAAIYRMFRTEFEQRAALVGSNDHGRWRGTGTTTAAIQRAANGGRPNQEQRIDGYS